MSDTNPTPTEVTYLENHWRHLQPHVREAIMTLVDAALTAGLMQVETVGKPVTVEQSTC
jgi:hypothetical protein